MHDDTCDYRALFLNDVRMMDARAPIEFNKGAFPGVVNLPLMGDSERQRVGLCYKQKGQDAAIALGHRLVSGASKAERIASWAAFARAHPDGYLYCFRGGLRSQITQKWLKEEAGIAYPRVIGGYKAMRTFLLQTTEQAVSDCGFVLLGGMTGTGKTDVLRQLGNGVDLEGHAHHRGSSFGKHASDQPVQIDFENRLSIDILKKRAAGHGTFVLEDESRTIGRCSLPLVLYQRMQASPIVWLEDSLDNRTQRILRDYIVNLHAEFVMLHGKEKGFILFAARLRQSLDNIVKRLGHARHQSLAAIMDRALAEQERSGAVEAHLGWIVRLLAEYYDPMYVYQRKHESTRIEFAGDQQAVFGYLRQRRSHPS